MPRRVYSTPQTAFSGHLGPLFPTLPRIVPPALCRLA
jgi:hypothetical protein